MKMCSKCKETKDESMFPRDKRRLSGLSCHCCACARVRLAEWRKKNPEKSRAANLRRNKDLLRAAHKKWRDRNIQAERQRSKLWAKSNPEKAAAIAAKRRAVQRSAHPVWANDFFIGEIYDLAFRRTAITGIPHEVDHIVPLISRRVCGLHVESNLRVIPARDNAVKGNRHWPEMAERI